MKVIESIKYGLAFALIMGLLFSSGLFSVLVYGKISGKPWAQPWYTKAVAAETLPAPARTTPQPVKTEAVVQAAPPKAEPIAAKPKPVVPSAPKKAASILQAPLVLQNPELPRGCEITSLTMLLQYYGIKLDKMELLKDMKFDRTPLQTDSSGRIVFWGNPNTGFVGDITFGGSGLGIYHAALFPTLKKHIPTAIDLTGSTFDRLEQQLSDQIPVVVWTTADYRLPARWVEWDSPTGHVRTTYSEHAVLMTGYDAEYVYFNDPLAGKSNVKVEKEQFITVWNSMGKQALSYEPFK